MAQNNERCIRVFLASCKTEVTKKAYLNSLNYFREFLQVPDFESIIKMDKKTLSEKLEDYIISKRETVFPNGFGIYYYPIQGFLEMNDIILNFKKIKRLIPQKVKSVVERGWTTEEIQKMLSVSKNLRVKSIILLEASSGGRLGIFDNLLIKHLIPINDPEYGKCYGIVGYADQREEYTTFLTPEATKTLDDYLDKRRSDGEIINPHSPVFRDVYQLGSQPVKISSTRALGVAVQRAQDKAGLRDPSTKKRGRYPVQTNHGFRRRFDTIMKGIIGINPHTVEKMLSHTSRLIALDAVYNNPTVENMFKEYRKAIPELTIDDTFRNSIERKRLETEKNELVKERSRNEELESRVSFLEKFWLEKIRADTRELSS